MRTSAHFLRRTRPAGGGRLMISASALLPLMLLASCAGPAKDLYRRLQDEDPVVRAEAAVEAAQTHNEKALPLLVERLGDVEKDVRLMASVALKDLAGAKTFEEMGWRLYDPPQERAKAVDRWRQWLRGRGMTPAPAASPSTGSGQAQPASLEESVIRTAGTRPAGTPTTATGPAPSPAALAPAGAKQGSDPA